jgi:hypothetical protein
LFLIPQNQKKRYPARPIGMRISQSIAK